MTAAQDDDDRLRERLAERLAARARRKRRQDAVRAELEAARQYGLRQRNARKLARMQRTQTTGRTGRPVNRKEPTMGSTNSKVDDIDMIAVDNLLDEQATKLARNMRARYIPAYETVLATRAIAAIEEGDRSYVLRHLLRDKLMGLVTVDNLLDETDDDSYKVVFDFAHTVFEKVRAQGTEADVLHRLVVEEIVTRARFQLERTESTSPDAMTATFEGRKFEIGDRVRILSDRFDVKAGAVLRQAADTDDNKYAVMLDAPSDDYEGPTAHARLHEGQLDLIERYGEATT